MKKAFILLGIILPLGATIYYIASSLVDTKHKYQIQYNYATYTVSDYTDTFQLTNNSVTYIDKHGAQIVRYGSFAIKNNVDYQK